VNADQWERAKEIFDAALKQSLSERQQFVMAACQGDPELLAEIESLLEADAAAGSFLDRPAIDLTSSDSDPAWKKLRMNVLSQGEVISGRFEIQRFLGEGGMGQVYEAKDIELGVVVALKKIRPEISSDENALVRFKKEVQLTRLVTHPNVCRIFDLGRHIPQSGSRNECSRPFAFLTMELLEGDTLSELLRRKRRFPAAEALPIVEQVAEGLAAAHRLGIVHRDIKPSNILLVRSGCPRAVITDFGLARTVTAETRPLAGQMSESLTGHGKTVGTLAYMAPEQLTGAEVTSATDIYAFGLVMYEMVTGVKPFDANLPLGGIPQRLNHSPESPRIHVPELDVHWESAVLGCLQVDPAARFQDAREVVEAIKSSTSMQRVSPKPSEVLVQKNWWRRVATTRRKEGALIFLAILLCLALFATVIRLYQSKADSKVAAGALIYLAPVRNETGEKSLDNLGELLGAGVRQSAHINLIDADRVGDILQQMTKPPNTQIDATIAREIAMRAGAVRVVFPTITGSDGTYHLSLDMQQPDSTPDRFRANWTNAWTWKPVDANPSTITPSLLRTVREASDWIRAEVGESANDIARLDVPPEDITTSSWQALAAYVQNNQFTRNGKREDAVIALQSAVNLDPGFALAYARLGDVLVSLGRTSEGYKAYAAALDPDLDRRLTRRERDRIRGMFALDTGDYLTADNSFRDYTAFYDKDHLGWEYRSYPLKMLGRTEEAVSVLRSAIALNSTLPFAPSELARYLLIQGNYQEAAVWIEHLRKNGYSESALSVEGPLYFLQFKFDEAELAMTELTKSPKASSRSDGYALLARLYAERGMYSKSIGIINRGIAEDQAQGNTARLAAKHLDRAYLECKLQQTDKCIDDVRVAVGLHSGPQSILRAGSILGAAHATASGNSAKAIVLELEDIERHLPKDNYGVISELTRARTHGELLLAKGETRAALAEFRKADQLDAPAGQREYFARALLEMASMETEAGKAREMMERALDCYSAMASKPGFIWHEAMAYPPGFLADEMEAYIHTAAMLNRTGPPLQSSKDFLAKVRNNATKS
jgi:serine/threonine protein kinase/tetratricopeptide (TPR) repeat protein